MLLILTLPNPPPPTPTHTEIQGLFQENFLDYGSLRILLIESNAVNAIQTMDIEASCLYRLNIIN